MLQPKGYSFLNKSTMRDTEMTLLHFAAPVHWEVLCVVIIATAFSRGRLLLYELLDAKHQINNSLLTRAFRFITRYTTLLLERNNCIQITNLTMETNYENSVPRWYWFELISKGKRTRKSFVLAQRGKTVKYSSRNRNSIAINYMQKLQLISCD